MKTESVLRKKIVKALSLQEGTIAFVYHATPFGVLGHSDIYGISEGVPFFIEVKVPGWKPRGKNELAHYKSQLLFLRRVIFYGGRAGFATNEQEAIKIIHSPPQEGDNIDKYGLFLKKGRQEKGR